MLAQVDQGDHGALRGPQFAPAVTLAGAIRSSADHALAESFHATFKRETPQRRKSRPNEREARLDAFRWLHRYNTRRRHSRLGQRPPLAFENDFPPTNYADTSRITRVQDSRSRPHVRVQTFAEAEGPDPPA
ncbi:hypothetical protein SNE510_74140 [Streptomyces sp. NE5-10]|nr:hypothetical protein SNE510_74140 [Streptomyces sp. NE5-10]